MNAVFEKLSRQCILRIAICLLVSIVLIIFLPPDFYLNLLIEEKFKDFYPTAIKLFLYSGVLLLVLYVLEYILKYTMYVLKRFARWLLKIWIKKYQKNHPDVKFEQRGN